MRPDGSGLDRLTWIALSSFAALVALLWLPFDLRRTPLVEWWSSHSVYDQIGFPLATSGMFKTRPLAALPYYLGYALTPDSYVGGSLVLALLIFARAALPYFVCRMVVPGRPALAYVYALLFALYPADSMQFALRAVGTHFTIVCYLFGTAFLVAYWRRPRLPLLLAMWISLAVGLLAAPTPYGAILVTPGLLYWMEGRISRRWVRVTLYWWAVPALVAAYIVFSSASVPGENYLERLWIWHGGMSPYKWKSLVLSLGLLFFRHFVSAWTAAAAAIFAHPPYALLGFGATCGLGTLIWLHLKKPATQEQLDLAPRAAGSGIFIGAALTFAGFLPFWPTSARLGDWRVYLVSPLGAALVILFLCVGVERRFGRRGWLFLCASAAVLWLAVTAALVQTAEYQERSRFEQRLLASLVRQAPALRDDVTIVVMDSSLDPEAELPAAFADDHFLYPHGFADALRYLYGDYDKVRGVAICSPTTRAECRFGPDHLRVDGRFSFPLRPAVVEDHSIPYENMLLFSHTEDGLLRLETEPPPIHGAKAYGAGYAPGRHIDPTAPLPHRFGTLFAEGVRETVRAQPSSSAGDPYG